IVDVSAIVIESLWTCSPSSNSSTQILGLRGFIRETLKRSKTTFSTLLTALIYVLRIKEYIPRTDNSFMLVRCGRRMFLAALILASKFLVDQSCSIRGWARITGLAVSEIAACELTLLHLLDHRLFVSCAVFSRWSTLL
ncbi:hypothetical protein K493DRAFT_196105, partial [Basidiobolus meristosporus CBS 931.73]